MKFDVEIVLKGRDNAVTESVSVARDHDVWTDAVVRDVLVAILRAIERADNPAASPDRLVVLRGFSWIVEPMDGQVVLAIEIPMGAAVAGPFAVDQVELDAMIARVVRGDRPRTVSPTVH